MAQRPNAGFGGVEARLVIRRMQGRCSGLRQYTRGTGSTIRPVPARPAMTGPGTRLNPPRGAERRLAHKRERRGAVISVARFALAEAACYLLAGAPLCAQRKTILVDFAPTAWERLPWVKS
jgi:hypothetical protein